jgi:dephospho-CoA kinase
MFVSAPLLLESGFDSLCTDLIIVDVDKNIQVERVIKRDNVSFDDAVKACALRMSIDQLIELAENRIFEPIIIKNNTGLDNLYIEINKVLDVIMED